MIAALREHQFDTVLGRIGFGAKGDLTVQNLVWYVWRALPSSPFANRWRPFG